MPVIQSTYATNIPAFKAGHVHDMTAADIVSRDVEPAGGIAFGLAVAQGAGSRGVIAYAGTGYLGITVRDRSVRIGELFSQYESARVLRKGPIAVLANVTVAAGDPVYLTAAGLFTNVATSNFQIPGARWEEAVAAGAVGPIFIK